MNPLPPSREISESYSAGSIVDTYFNTQIKLYGHTQTIWMLL